MQGGFKILSHELTGLNLAAEKFTSLCKKKFYSSAALQNFKLLVFWQRAYAAYVFARGINFQSSIF